MANSYAARVKGTLGTLPRGYPWVSLVWYAIVGTIFAAFAGRSWFAIAGGIVIFAVGVGAARIIRNEKPVVFRARPQGIRLGGKRHSAWLPWQEIQEIRISQAADGALADILLLPSAPVALPRLSPTAEALLTFVPGSYLFLNPPLLTPLTDPIRYSVPLWGVTADEVAERLQSLAPDSVAIAR